MVWGNVSGGNAGQQIAPFRRQFDDVVVSINGEVPEPTAALRELVVTESEGLTRVGESGARDTASISLSARPTGNVNVGVFPSESNQIELSQPTITFTPDNWDTPQLVSISAVDDNADEDTLAVDLAFSVLDGSDPAWSLVDDEVIEVEVIDNDHLLGNDVELEGVVSLSGESGETVTLDFQWLQRLAGFENELGFFVVDNTSGSLDGMPANSMGYAAAALSHASRQVIFRSGEGAVLLLGRFE